MYVRGMPKQVTRPFTAILKKSGDILELAADQDVLLKRRDGADMLLVEAERESGLRDGFAVAASVIAAAIADKVSADLVVTRLETAVPWTEPLPVAARHQLLRDFANGGSAAFATGDFTSLARLLDEWRETARIYGDDQALADFRAGPAVEGADLSEPLTGSAPLALSSSGPPRRPVAVGSDMTEETPA